MRSAQRRNRLKAKARKGNYLYLLKLLVIPVVLIVVFLFFKLTTRYWNGSDKVSYVYREENGNVVVTVLDPKLSEATSLIIPGDTQINVAGNYGTLRIKNVWQLGINEKKEHLLASTITKSFYFPVFLWTGSDAVNLKNANLSGVVKFVFSPKKTNIPLGDRAMIAIFSLQVKSIDRTEIDLGESKYLKKIKLNDGESGYVLSGPVSERLTVYFSDNDFADENLKAGIIDATGDAEAADDVGQIIQVLGGKVISVEKKIIPSESDCFVLGNNTKVVEKLKNLFGCKKINESSTLDLEVRLGSEFAKRF